MQVKSRSLCCLLLILAFGLVNAETATIARLAQHSLLLDISHAQGLTVAVGERGHILYQYDDNEWTQATVDTQSLLTAAFLLDGKTGFAVGHDGVIIKTSDAAKSWQLVHRATEDEAPLLDVYFSDADNGIAVGAYGLFYTSSNGGNDWQLQEVSVSNQDIFDNELLEPLDLHLNAVTAANEQRLYMAAERGFILRSDNAGKEWKVLKTPYQGSFFGVLALSADEILAYGLRGHIYHSIDAGETWEEIETGTTAMLTDAVILADSSTMIAGMAGTLLLAPAGSNEFRLIQLKQRDDIAAIIQRGNGALLTAGENGFALIPLDQLKVGPW